MKINYWCDVGANIHSKYKSSFDTERDLDLNDEEWTALPDADKDKIVQEYVMERLDWGYHED